MVQNYPFPIISKRKMDELGTRMHELGARLDELGTRLNVSKVRIDLGRCEEYQLGAGLYEVGASLNALQHSKGEKASSSLWLNSSVLSPGLYVCPFQCFFVFVIMTSQ